jgi:hypothetical protein
MKTILTALATASLLGTAALAAGDDATPSPASNWVLAADETYTVLLANWSSADLTYIYRVCLSDGPAARISTNLISGQPVTIAKGQCVDVATQGSVRLTRADATGNDVATGTYQFIHAARNHVS